MVGLIPARVSLGLLATAGIIIIYITRINLSVAIINMVKIRGQNDSLHTMSAADRLPYCHLLNDQKYTLLNQSLGETNTQTHTNDSTQNTSSQEIMIDEANLKDNRMILTTVQRGAILGAFFYGLTLSSIAGGCVADKFGTKRVFGTAVFVDGITQFLVPLAARTHYSFLIILRLIGGVFQGACYPSLHALMAVWIPPVERSRFIAFVYYSSSTGIMIGMPMCGIIIDSFGWEAVFYITGSMSLTFVVVWTLFMHERPEDHPRISQAERTMIKEAICVSGIKKKPKSVPWLNLLTSLPLLAISVAHIGHIFGYNMLVTQLPIYMSSIIGLPIKKNAVLSSIPFISRVLGANIFGWFGSFIVKKGFLQPLTSKKLFTCLGLVAPAAAIVLAGYMGCSAISTLTFFALGTFFNGATTSGYTTNHLEIAPNFGGTCLGVSNTYGFGISMLAPVLIGALTPDETIHQWRQVFWITFGAYVFGTIFYTLFSSSEVQPWNNVSDFDDEDGEDLKAGVNQKNDYVEIVEIKKIKESE